MIASKMKKISMLILNADFDKFIRELIFFGCVDIESPGDFDVPEENEMSFLEREIVDLGQYDSNRESITVYKTDYTVFIKGWIPVGAVDNLLTILSGYVHAWDIQDPSPDELDKVPARVGPKVFGSLFKGARRPYSPLRHELKIDD